MMTFWILSETGEFHLGPMFSALRPWIGCDRYECSVCGVIGLKSAPRNLAVKVKRVGRLDDVQQALTSKLVSRRFRRAVERASLTGIEFRDVLEFRPTNNNPRLVEFARRCAEEYKAAWPCGSGGSIAKTCGVKVAKACDVCGWVEWTTPENGVIVDEKEWDGSDFFHIIEMCGPIFMSDRAVEVLSKAGLSNFAAKPAHEHYPGGKRRHKRHKRCQDDF